MFISHDYYVRVTYKAVTEIWALECCALFEAYWHLKTIFADTFALNAFTILSRERRLFLAWWQRKTVLQSTNNQNWHLFHTPSVQNPAWYHQTEINRNLEKSTFIIRCPNMKLLCIVGSEVNQELSLRMAWKSGSKVWENMY